MDIVIEIKIGLKFKINYEDNLKSKFAWGNLLLLDFS